MKSVVPESDVFQTPPPTAAAYHVLPVLSAASTTIDLVLPGTFAGPLSVNVAVAAAEVQNWDYYYLFE